LISYAAAAGWAGANGLPMWAKTRSGAAQAINATVLWKQLYRHSDGFWTTSPIQAQKVVLG